MAGESGLQARAMLLIFPGLRSDWVQQHLAVLAQIKELSLIELKPLRPAGTDLAPLGPPHVLALAAAAQTIHQALPDVRIAVSSHDLSDDAITLLHRHGLAIAYDSAKEILS
jgi:hypothetical protein